MGHEHDAHLQTSKSQGQFCSCCHGKYEPLNEEECARLATFDRPLPCFGCGIGWCFLLLGFICPILWYYSAFLYLFKYYDRDPRERPGLMACSIVALLFTIALSIVLAVIFL